LNFTAGLMLAKGFRQRGVAVNPSSIAFIGSVAGLTGQPGLVAYSASKGAVFAMTRTLALELASEGIRVNAVSPGLVKTNMARQTEETLTTDHYQELEQSHPLGLGAPDDIAHAVAYLLSDTGRWITGSTLVVDGGFTAK